MYRKSFPKCEVIGDFKPVKFGHMLSDGSIPYKCSKCSNLFEGECTRGVNDIDGLLRLDYNSCGIDGPTEPVEIEIKNENPILIPKKCSNCKFLKKSDINGYFCGYENDKWKDFPRDLDWGEWKPDYPLIGLIRYKISTFSNEYIGPAIITKELVSLLIKNDTTKAIKLYRKLNGVESIKDASDDIKTLLNKLKNT